MKEWFYCVYFDNDKPCGAFPCVCKTAEMVTVLFNATEYDIPIERCRNIAPPKYDYGDLVSPVNHPELTGTIVGIGFHFEKNEPMYFVEINGIRKSKRYFSTDLLRRN